MAVEFADPRSGHLLTERRKGHPPEELRRPNASPWGEYYSIGVSIGSNYAPGFFNFPHGQSGDTLARIYSPRMREPFSVVRQIAKPDGGPERLTNEIIRGWLSFSLLWPLMLDGFQVVLHG